MSQSLFAQQDAQFSQYLSNRLYLNPAYAGVAQDWNEVLLAHRSQWLGYNPSFDDGGSPSTQILSLNVPLTKQNVGFGLHLLNDKVGLTNTFELQLSSAYHLKLKKGLISLGLRLGLINHSINTNELRFRDADDPQLQSLIGRGKLSQMAPDIGAGIYYNTAGYFLGFSVSHLLPSSYDYSTAFSVYSLQKHFTFLGGLNLNIGRYTVVTPSVLVKSDFNQSSVEGGVLVEYAEKYFGGISLRELDAAILILGFSPLSSKRLRINYALDFILGTQSRNAKEASSHEISLTYRLPVFSSFGPRPIRTPRFRHF